MFSLPSTWKLVVGFAGVLLLIALGLAGTFTLITDSYKKQITALQNDVALRDKTIELQAGVYQKLSIQSHGLQDMLNQQDVQLAALQEQLAKNGADLLTATTLIVKLKKELQSHGNVVVAPTDPTYPDIIHATIDSKEDFAPFRVTGDIVADCSMREDVTAVPVRALLRMSQTRPLRLSVIVSQDKDGTWKTSTTSSEDNFQIDIGLAAVNPYMLESKWYEKIGLHADVGVGTGILVGLGASYKIGKFTVGPTVWGAMNWDLAPKGYLGATLGWNPFQRD